MLRKKELGEGILLAIFLAVVILAVTVITATNRSAATTVTPIHHVEIQTTEVPRININTASAEELAQINGIGNAIAERIIEKRKESGRFEHIEDLLEVQGIGEAKLDAIRDRICIE